MSIDVKYFEKPFTGDVDINGRKITVKDAVFNVDMKSEFIVWYSGIWVDGLWKSGIWKSGEWISGEWMNGEWVDGTWFSGIWNTGKWNDGIWYNEKSEWKNGLWLKGYDKNKIQKNMSPDKW